MQLPKFRKSPEHNGGPLEAIAVAATLAIYVAINVPVNAAEASKAGGETKASDAARAPDADKASDAAKAADASKTSDTAKAADADKASGAAKTGDEKTADSSKSPTKTMVEGGPSTTLLSAPPLIQELNNALQIALHGEMEKGISMLDDLIKKAPQMALAYNDRGMLYYRSNKLDKAEEDLNKALELDKSDSEYWSNRGLIYMMKGSEEDAMKDLNQAITISEKNTLALATRGAIFMRRGKFDEAKKDFNLALTSDPKSALNLNNRAMARFQTGDAKGAMEDISAAIEVEPNSDVFKRNQDLFKRASPGELSIQAESELSVRNGHLRKGENAPPAVPIDNIAPDAKK